MLRKFISQLRTADGLDYNGACLVNVGSVPFSGSGFSFEVELKVGDPSSSSQNHILDVLPDFRVSVIPSSKTVVITIQNLFNMQVGGCNDLSSKNIELLSWQLDDACCVYL